MIRKRRVIMICTIKPEIRATNFVPPLIKGLMDKRSLKKAKLLHLDPVEENMECTNFIRIPVMARTEWGAKRKVAKLVNVKAKYLEFVL